jgi:hypothetical protein
MLRERAAAMLGQHARVAELVGVADRRQPAHHLQLAHLLQRAEVGVAESLMPPPGFIILMHHETEWPCHLQLQPIHAILAPLHLGEQASLLIPNLQHTSFDQHARATLIHLLDAYDRVPQARNQVHTCQHLVLTTTPGEDDDALAADVDNGAVSELDGALHCQVKLGEYITAPRHVVRRTRVEVPALKTVIVVGACAEECLRLGLVQVDKSLFLQRRFDSVQWRWRIFNFLHHGHLERRFIALLSLGQIRPVLWLAALTCPMTGAAAVVTFVITLRALLPTVATLARMSPLLTAVERALPSFTALEGLLLPFLLCEEQLAVYARRW